MPVIRIPAPYRPYTGGASELQSNAAGVGAALSDLFATYPALRPHLVNPSGQLRPFINLFVNDQHVKDLDGLNTPLAPEDILRIIPSIAGG